MSLEARSYDNGARDVAEVVFADNVTPLAADGCLFNTGGEQAVEAWIQILASYSLREPRAAEN